MTTFAYVGRMRGGQLVQGERAAETTAALVAALRREQVLVTKVGPAKSGAGSGASATSRWRFSRVSSP